MSLQLKVCMGCMRKVCFHLCSGLHYKTVIHRIVVSCFDPRWLFVVFVYMCGVFASGKFSVLGVRSGQLCV